MKPATQDSNRDIAMPVVNGHQIEALSAASRLAAATEFLGPASPHQTAAMKVSMGVKVTSLSLQSMTITQYFP